MPDYFDFIVAFFKVWRDDAYYRRGNALEWWMGRRLARCLDRLGYDGGVAVRFRQVYGRWAEDKSRRAARA